MISLANSETGELHTVKVILHTAILQYSQFHKLKIELPTVHYFLQANDRIVSQLDHNSFLPNPSILFIPVILSFDAT
jgi:hypothetical protein